MKRRILSGMTALVIVLMLLISCTAAQAAAPLEIVRQPQNPIYGEFAYAEYSVEVADAEETLTRELRDYL